MWGCARWGEPRVGRCVLAAVAPNGWGVLTKGSPVVRVRRIGLAGYLGVALAVGFWTGGVARGQEARESEPPRFETPEAMVDYALAKIVTGDLQEAAEILRTARSIKPGMAKLLLAQGLMDIELNQHLTAVRLLQEYNKTEAAVNDYRGHSALGTIYKDSGMPRRAAPALRKAKDLAPIEENGEPVRAMVAMELAMVYDQLEKKGKALETAREAKRLAQNDAGVQLQFAQIAAETEEYAEASSAVKTAIKLLKAELKKDPLNEETYYRLRSAYSMAINLQRRESLSRPDDGQPFIKSAELERESAEVERRTILLRAREYVLQALSKEPENLEWKVLLAEIDWDLGAVSEARKEVEEVLASDPNHRGAARLRDRIRSVLPPS